MIIINSYNALAHAPGWISNHLLSTWWDRSEEEVMWPKGLIHANHYCAFLLKHSEEMYIGLEKKTVRIIFVHKMFQEME